MVSSRRKSARLLFGLLILLTLALVGTAGAQGISGLNDKTAFTPASAGPTPQIVGTPNVFGPPGSPSGAPICPDVIPLSSGMFAPWLPSISNLELGFLWTVGPNLSAGRGTLDYLLPIRSGDYSVIFGEAHAEFQNFWRSPSVSTVTGPGFTVTNSTANDRTDISLGGGYRTLFGKRALVGVNGFYDTSRLFGQWFSAGGVGLETAAIGPGNSAIDLNVNYYGNLFLSEGLRNAFRNKGGSWDIEAGYLQPLFNEAFDLRLKFNGYQFDVGESVCGWRTGADLTTRDNTFSIRYEYGYDKVNGSYNTIGAFANVGFQLENIFRGESPVTMPQPIFASPRSLAWLLTRKVHRNWHQPTAVVLTNARGAGAGGSGCDRFVLALALVVEAGTTHVFDTAFPAFPRSSLDPTKHVVMEFDFDFKATPTGPLTWVIDVRAPFPGVAAQNFFIAAALPPPTSASGHMSVTLSTIGNQGNFITAGVDPDGMSLTVIAPGTAPGASFTNLCVRFNQ
jgi:hypothetical protein